MMFSLILYFLHIEPKSYDDVAKYWKTIEYLEKQQILPMPTIPLKLN